MNKAENIRNGNVNIRCKLCGGCGYHKMSCSVTNLKTFINPDSRLSKRLKNIAKCEAQKVKRNKDVEP